MVDGAEDRRRVEGVEEGARTVVDGFTGDGGVVGVHDAMDKPDQHPVGHQGRLPLEHRLEECEVAVATSLGREP